MKQLVAIALLCCALGTIGVDANCDQGPPGPRGITGFNGSDSTVPGPQGEPGPEGPMGPVGANGTASTVAGPRGVTGATGPAGGVGATGAAGAASTVAGPTGPAGPAGAAGVTGAASTVAGPVGATGVTGVAGPIGPTGAVGAASTVPGPIGPTGAVGATGAPGGFGTGDQTFTNNITFTGQLNFTTGITVPSIKFRPVITGYGKSLLSDALGNTAWQSNIDMIQRSHGRVLMRHSFGVAVLDIDLWKITTDNLEHMVTAASTQVVTPTAGYINIAGVSGVTVWAGKGLMSVKTFDNQLDYDFSVDAWIDNNGGVNSAITLEFHTPDTTEMISHIFSFSAGLQRSAWANGERQLIDIDSIGGTQPYQAATWQTFLIKKRGRGLLAYNNGKLMYMSDWWLSKDFSVRLMGYPGIATDNSLFRFRNFLVTVYPVVHPMRTFATVPLLQPSGGGWEGTWVKDPEYVKAGSQYYMYYSGWDGSTFRSGVVPLGTSLSSPVLGTRTQLTLTGVGAVDNGAPCAYWDGTDMWLFMQTPADTAASIQIFKSTTTGSTTAFTRQGIAVAGNEEPWRFGVYDPSIVQRKINGLYYLYFTAHCGTFNTLGFVRTQGLATASSLSGPWTVVGQVRSQSEYDSPAFGMEAQSVVYDAKTATFHMQAVGGRLQVQELQHCFFSYDGRNFMPCSDALFKGGGQLDWNAQSAGSGCLYDNSDVDGNWYNVYQALPVGGSPFTIAYDIMRADEMVQRALVLPVQ